MHTKHVDIHWWQDHVELVLKSRFVCDMLITFKNGFYSRVINEYKLMMPTTVEVKE